VVLLFAFSVAMQAQSTNATLSGVVRDSTGAMIPNATLVATEITTGRGHRVTSSDAGNYSLSDLPIGDYKIEVSGAGFKTERIPTVTLHTAQAAALDFTLQIGEATEQVVVTTEIPLLNTQSSSAGQTVENKSIESQPLNGRSFWQLVALVPGASYTPGGQGTATGGASIRSNQVNVQINGSGYVTNGWLLDGGDITEYEQGGTNVQPDVDALSEFKVFSANMPAEYGHTGNVVTVTMKSGGNQFHGTVFEFIRNDIIDAANYFTGTDVLKRNQFGGTFSGPIKRDKVFFFADFEETRQSQGIPFSLTVPTDVERAGVFPKAIKDPINGGTFLNNTIPMARFSAQANYFLPYLPAAAQAKFTGKQSLDITKGDIKIDTALTTKDHLFGRYSIVDNKEQDPNQFPALKYQNLASRAQNIALGETHTFGDHWLNELRAGYYRDYFLFSGILTGTNFEGGAGITGYEQTQLTPSFPYITLSGYSSFNGSYSGNFPKSNRIQTWQYADTVIYNKGKHEVRFGFQMWDQRHTFVHGQGQEGSFGFTGEYTGDAFADYLLGYPFSAYRSFPLTLYGNDGREHAAFAEDTWHVMNNLTLDYGLRYERNPFFQGVNGGTTGFDYNTGNLVIPMQNGQLIDPNIEQITPIAYPLFADRIEGTDALHLPVSIRKTGSGQLAPRFGFAYKPNGSDKLVVRSAFGLFPIFFDTNVSQFATQSPPFLVAQTVNNPAGKPAFTWANPFQGQPIISPNSTNAICPNTTKAYATCLAPLLQTEAVALQHTYMEEYNLQLQWQFLPDLSATIGYVGNHTLHGQQYSVPTNTPSAIALQGPNSGTPTTAAVQGRRPFPQWGQINAGFTFGAAHYDSLQATLEKRFGKGWYALVSYSHAKCLDNGSNEGAPIALQYLPYNYAVCSYDIPNNLTVSAVYDLPFGEGKQFMNHGGVADYLVGGWQLAGIFMDRTGQPYTPVLSGDPANIGVSGTQFPIRIGNPNIAHTLANKAAHYFDPGAFAFPSVNGVQVATSGYINLVNGRNILRSQGLVNLDATLKKNFNISEAKSFELRLESFNVTNHPTFAAPNATVTLGATLNNTNSVGKVSSTLNNNRIFQAALKFFF
jgi:hypothetical protein